MTDDKRGDILAIKEVACTWPEYRRSVCSSDIYRAVLEHNVCDIDQFKSWLQEVR